MAPDAGVSVTLSRIVGFRKAMEILLTNPVLSAKEALALGLVNRVVPDAELEAASIGLAQELSRGAPKALAETKRLLWEGHLARRRAGLPRREPHGLDAVGHRGLARGADGGDREAPAGVPGAMTIR